jgi:hypothetical protein
MKLQTIDKKTYRKRLNILLAITVIVLLLTSLSVSNILIALFGTGIEGDHFWLNLIGVVSGLVVVAIMNKVLLTKPFMSEVSYVRNLKKEMNRIYRRSKSLQQKVEENDETALIINYFNFQASKQVYELDNNTLTMDELNEKIRLLDEKLDQLGLDIKTENYHSDLLSKI